MATTPDTPLQARSLAPNFTVNDLQQSIRCFEALGFGIEERWEENGIAARRDVAGRPGPHRPEPGRLEEGPRQGEGCGDADLHRHEPEHRRPRRQREERWSDAGSGAARHTLGQPRVRSQRPKRVQADNLVGAVTRLTERQIGRPCAKHSEAARKSSSAESTCATRRQWPAAESAAWQRGAGSPSELRPRPGHVLLEELRVQSPL